MKYPGLYLHYALGLGSFVKNRAKATPKKAPASVSVAFSHNTKAKLAHISTAPSTLVFQLSNILLNISFIFKFLAPAAVAVGVINSASFRLLRFFHFLYKIVKAVFPIIGHLSKLVFI